MLTQNPKQGKHSRNAAIIMLLVVMLLQLVTFKKKISVQWGEGKGRRRR